MAPSLELTHNLRKALVEEQPLCATAHVRPHRGAFYCVQCDVPRCAECAIHGFCMICRANVRSIFALQMRFKENPNG